MYHNLFNLKEIQRVHSLGVQIKLVQTFMSRILYEDMCSFLHVCLCVGGRGNAHKCDRLVIQ